MNNSIDRKKYIKECNKLGEEVIYKEHLPFTSDIMSFASKEEVSDRLQHVFDVLDNADSLHNQITRNSLRFIEGESKEFIDTVISANITDIRLAGSLYKQLMATGDDLRIKGNNCGSNGREIALPIDEDTFYYEIRNSYVYFDDKKDLQVFYEYKDLQKACKGHDKVFVRTPMTCKHRDKRGVCKTCAGQVPENTQNIGAFSTLMVTEFATQSALSSMNKGTKENVNTLLVSKHDGVKTWDDFDKWADDILNKLMGRDVERRFYEIILIGRARSTGKDNKVEMSSLMTPKTNNYFGAFIYRPKESTYREILKQKSFEDTSLKFQIATNQYHRNKL